MAQAHSYTITKKNNRTENEAVEYLLKANKRFIKPSKDERKKILDSLGLNGSFSRAFDLVLLPVGKKLTDVKKQDLVLVELKTTKKKLVTNPSGFFFGATENEFNLAKKLGEQYKFCFVSLHPESLSLKLLSLSELEKLIRTKRTQYQINL